MRFPIKRVLLILLVLVAASLSCNLPARGIGAQPTQTPLDPQSAQQIEDQFKATLSSAPVNTDITVTITQQQLNSLISDKIASEPYSPIQDPQVTLTGGQMEIVGMVSEGGFSTNSTTVVRPGVNADGSPRLEVLSIQLGAFPAPDALRQQVSDLVDSAFRSYLTENEDRFKVTNISIAEGYMTVTGQRIQ